MKSIKVHLFLFIVACFAQLESMAQSQGPLNPGTKVNNSLLGGSIAWTTPNNSGASDNSYAVATNGQSNFLNVSNFGFSIPLTANITGIVAEIERKGAPVNPVVSGTWASYTPPAYTSGTATAVYGTTTYSYNLPVSSATNNKRLLVVTVGIENVDNVGTTDPSITFGTVTYNGVAMTLATSNSMASATTSNNVAVYYLTESGLPSTTGSRNIVVNKTINGELASGTISQGEYVEVVGVNIYSNVEQATPVSAVTTTIASSPITSPSINYVRNGDYLVAATMNNTSSGGSVTQAGGFTENFEIANNNTAGSTSGAILEVQSKSLSGVTGSPTVTVSATAAGASRLVMGAISVNAARVYDDAVMLTNGLGLQTGNDLAVTPGSSLPNAWPDTDTYQSYGGSSNLWGTTWTAATINSAGFGLSFQANAPEGIASVDHIRLTVYYSIPLSVTYQSLTLTKTENEIVSLFAFQMDDAKEYLFTLEKAGSDLNFVSVNSTSAIGKQTIQKATFTDASPDHGVNYYRIRIEEKSQGAPVTYSSVQKIVFGNGQSDILIYPNPVVDYLMVESAQAIISISVLDLTGTTVSAVITSFDGSKFKVENIASKGVCTLVVSTVSGTINKKIIVN